MKGDTTVVISTKLFDSEKVIPATDGPVIGMAFVYQASHGLNNVVV